MVMLILSLPSVPSPYLHIKLEVGQPHSIATLVHSIQELLDNDEKLQSVVDQVMASGSFKLTLYLVYLIFIATIGPLQFGYHLGELNAPQKVITCQFDKIHTIIAANIPQCIPMSTGEWGLVQSIFTLGGLVGALVAGPASTKYGRLLVMRATTPFFVFGALAEALAGNVGVMSFGRFLGGVGAGASTVVCPIYVSEVSPPEKKGLFGAFTQVMINVGILIAQTLGYFLSRGSLWRIILATAGLIGALELLGLYFAPETPKWLAEHKRTAEAQRVLQRIRGQDADIKDEIKDWNSTSEEEEESLLAAPREEQPSKQPDVSFFGAVKAPKYRAAVVGVVAVMAAQQLTGINSIIMYSVSILATILPSSAALITVLVSAINVLVTLICAPLADKIGRKTVLLLSIGGIGTSSVLLAIGLGLSIRPLSGVATLLFVASFGVGLGPVPFILASELVGPEAVGATQSWALASNWIATFIVAQFFPILNAALDRGRSYRVFAAVALVLGSFIAWWVPETKDKASADEVWGRTEDLRVD